MFTKYFYQIGLLVFLFTQLITANAIAQNCKGITSTLDKDKKIETYKAILITKEKYNFEITKEVDRNIPAKAPVYSIFIMASTKDSISNEVMNKPASMNIILQDQSETSFNQVTLYNNPLKFCCNQAFMAILTEKQIKEIADNPISELKILDVTASFNDKKQAEQEAIYNCLLEQN